MCDGDDIGEVVGDVIEGIFDAEVSGKWVWPILLLVFVVCVYLYEVNKVDCGKRHCTNGQQSQLLDHKCVCVEPLPQRKW